ncbi:MAG: glycosyltransferase family 2 protein [Patescibacteria group bacterium]
MGKISVVINTLNEAKNLPRAITSIKGLASEIVVIDMESDDKTAEIAKKLGARVFSHKRVGYVEPARNFGISKAKNEWILILDADEEIPESLSKKLQELIKNPSVDYFRIPRKNIILGHFMEHTRWWPDYNIRFFRRGFVSWGDEIHSIPVTKGKGEDVKEKEEYAIIHHNYNSITDYLTKMLRYSEIQSEELMKNGYVFEWQDLIKKPMNEFLSRFFAGEGYKDGIYGLAFSVLQSFSEFVLYLRVWEAQGSKDINISKREYAKEFKNGIKDSKWWLRKKFSLFGRFF